MRVKIFGVLVVVLFIIGLFLSFEQELELILYLGIFLAIIFGSAGVAFVTKRIEALVGGLIIGTIFAAFGPTILETLKESLALAFS